MATVRNKTTRPLKVHISKDKVLHLGPRMEGKIADHDLDHRGVEVLVEAGELEIVGRGEQGPEAAHDDSDSHEDSRGHHPDISVPHRGDR